MKYIELKQYLKDFTVFSLIDIERIDGNFHRRRLNEWQDKGYIKKVIRGYYIFSDLELDENALFEISNEIYSPSYVSFEMALSYYGLIPEGVYGITSAATHKTYKFKTAIGEFSYRTIKPALFWGYDIVKYKNKRFKIASMEKAVLDYLYINSGIKQEFDFAGIRINKESFLKQLNESKLTEFLKRFPQKTLAKKTGCFLEFIKNA